jgi:hypothetical protein
MKSNLYEYRKKYTLPEITEILGLAIKSVCKKGIDVLIIDKKIFIRKNGFDLNVEIHFDTSGTHGNYTTVDLKVINTLTQVSGNHLRINTTDKKYGSRSDLKGGYYWATDSEFYAYVPDFRIVLDEINEFLKFLGF